MTCEDSLSDTLSRAEIQALIGDRVAEAIELLQSSEIVVQGERPRSPRAIPSQHAAEDIESKPIQYFAPLDKQLASKLQPAAIKTTSAIGKPKVKTSAKPRPEGSIALVTFANSVRIRLLLAACRSETPEALSSKQLACKALIAVIK